MAEDEIEYEGLSSDAGLAVRNFRLVALEHGLLTFFCI